MTTSSRPSAPIRASAFTLVELVMAISVIGLVLAAVVVFFTASSESADRIMGREAAEADAVQASTRLADLVASAGLTRTITYGEWHPILLARRDRLTFVTDTERPGSAGPEDIITIVSAASGILVTDAAGEAVFRSAPSVGVCFAYLDWEGEPIDSLDLCGSAGMDRIRRIEWDVVAEYADGTYEIHGGCSPPNLMLR